jgi:hypothetical protein
MTWSGGWAEPLSDGRHSCRATRSLVVVVALLALAPLRAHAQPPSCAPDTASMRRDSTGLQTTVQPGDTALAPVPAPSGGTALGTPIDQPTVPPSTSPFVTLERPSILADTGTYVYALSPQESDDVRAAIEHTIAKMGLIPKMIARHRLIRANHPSTSLTFAVGVDTLSVTFFGHNPIVTPLTGETVPWRWRTTHETYAVHVAVAGDTLRQVIAQDDGQRENDFVFLDGGATIAMYVTLRAQRLPMPLRYMELFREVRIQPDSTSASPAPASP